MQRERVANNIYLFTSELYAQVTCGVIMTPAGAILIDTLAYSAETIEVKNFVEGRYSTPVRYVINTHYHADHTYGTYLFPDAHVVGHALCREILDTRGRVALKSARSSSSQLAGIKIVLPDIVFDDGAMSLHLGGTTVTMRHTPGHSPDGISCLVEEHNILFAGDTLMPVPFFADGSIDDFEASLEMLLEMKFDAVIQGHGEIVLRGEIKERIKHDLKYLKAVRRKVNVALGRKDPFKYLDGVDIESCGISRIPLNGLVRDLHHSNLESLFYELSPTHQKEVPEVG